MLPSVPPQLSGKDFNPATMAADGDVEMEFEEPESKVELSSVEINILIYLYLLESNFSHTAFALLSESNLAQTSLFQHFNPSFPSTTPSGSRPKPNGNSSTGPSKSPRDGLFGRAGGKIERGELIRRLWKGLRWEEIERHVAANGEPYKPACPNPFHMLIPHVCPRSYPSSASNPPLPLPSSVQVSPPPRPQAEVFPPPEQSVAGPSKSPAASTTKSAGIQTLPFEIGTEPKRMSESTSVEPGSRNPSRIRSISPVKDLTKKKEKKRARLSEGNGSHDVEDMDIDDPPRRIKLRTMDSPLSGSLGLPVSMPSTGEDEILVKQPEKKGKEKQKDIVDSAPKDASHHLRDVDIAVLSDHRDVILCLAWNPRNLDDLITCSGDGTARLWELETSSLSSSRSLLLKGKPVVFPHKGVDSGKKSVCAVMWHPDGTVLATACSDGVGRLFTPSGQLIGIMSYGRGALTTLAFNPCGSHLLTATTDFTVCLWAIADNNNMLMQRLVRVFEPHSSIVNDVDWLDDHVFASCGNDHTIFVFRSGDKRPHFIFKGHTDDVTRVKWSPARPGTVPQERLLASVSDDGKCLIWRLPAYPEDWGSGSRSISPVKPTEEGEDDCFQDDEADSRFCVNKLVVVSESENTRMNTVEWAPCCKEGRMMIAVAGNDSTVKLFDALSGETLHVLRGLESGTASIAFAPISVGLIAAGGWNGKLMIWDVETGARLREHVVEEEQSRPNGKERPMMHCMAWRDDGEQLAVGMSNKNAMTVYVGDVGAKTDRSDGAD